MNVELYIARLHTHPSTGQALGSSHKCVLWAIAAHKNRRRGDAYPSARTVAEETHLSRPSVYRLIEELAGIVEAVPGVTEKGRPVTTYRFPDWERATSEDDVESLTGETEGSDESLTGENDSRDVLTGAPEILTGTAESLTGSPDVLATFSPVRQPSIRGTREPGQRNPEEPGGTREPGEGPRACAREHPAFFPDEGPDIWTQVLARLAVEAKPGNFRMWLANTWLVGQEGDMCLVGAPDPFQAEWLESRYAGWISHVLSEVRGEPSRVRFLSQRKRDGPSYPSTIHQVNGARP